jgi:hypothetical protein
MKDTNAKVARMVADRHRAMTPDERCLAASSLFDVARSIVEASLPDGLTEAERRLAVARRVYGTELPEAALAAYARYEAHLSAFVGKQGSGRSDVSVRVKELLTDSIAAKTSCGRAGRESDTK